MFLLLLSLAAVVSHSACKRAEGLELMLKLEDWKSHQRNDKDQHKASKCAMYDHPDHYPSVLDQILYLPACW